MKTGKTCWRIGITGGIGAGKSTVCQIFQALGIPVYDADYWAKWLIGHDPAVKAGMIGLFGKEVYKPDGSYDRNWVAGIVFQDAAKLEALNRLVHPAVERHSLAWHDEQAVAGRPYTLREAALLIESGNYKSLDRLILVTAPDELRIQRVMQRDQASEASVQARIAAQMPEAEKKRYADFVIENDGMQALIPQVLEVHRRILAL